jgi:2-methylisocitrate lyase-like PEP mutase family enzyme
MTQKEKADRLQVLHQGDEVLLFPNPWDGGSARMLELLGYRALATSSGACAATLGRRDGKVTREETIEHCQRIVEATQLPVAADLENGFGVEPAVVMETIRLAAAAGLVGGSIEDSTGNPDKPQYELSLATERIAAAVSAARALPFHFTLTARAENFIRGSRDLNDTIKRLAAYEQAGADVLFAPALPDLAAVREVCSAVRKPVNFMVGIKGKSFTVEGLVAAGVKRISFASSLYRAAMTGFLHAAREIKESGHFRYLETTMTTPELSEFLLP